MNQGIHTLDLLIFFAGPVHSVAGFYGVFLHKIEAEDQVVAVLKFENGALGTLFTSTCCMPDRGQRVTLYGTKGSFSRYGSTLEFYEVGSEKDRKRMMDLFGAGPKSDAASRDPMAVSVDGHTLIVEDMVRAIRQDCDPVIPLSSAKHSVQVAYAIYQSARKGREVKIEEVRQ